MRVLIINFNNLFPHSLSGYLNVWAYNSRIIFKDDIEVHIDYNPTHIVLCGESFSDEDSKIVTFVLECFSSRPVLFIGSLSIQLASYYGHKAIINEEKLYGMGQEAQFANGDNIFKGVCPISRVGIYSKYFIRPDNLPDDIQVLSDINGNIPIAFKIKDSNIFALFFYPHSCMTDEGSLMLENFLSLRGCIYA